MKSQTKFKRTFSEDISNVYDWMLGSILSVTVSISSILYICIVCSIYGNHKKTSKALHTLVHDKK